jgi:chromosome segregation ATPase
LATAGDGSGSRLREILQVVKEPSRDVATYHELLKAIDDDRDYDESAAIAVMHAAVKTAADLDPDVERLRQRRKWDAQIDDAKLARQEHESAVSELEQLGRQRELAIENAVRAIDKQIADQRAIVRRAEGQRDIDRIAKRMLVDGASAELRARESQLQGERYEIVQSVGVLGEHVASIERDVKTHETDIERLKKRHVPGDPTRFNEAITAI